MSAQSFNNIRAMFQRIDQSKVFQIFVIAVILISALTVGAHTYELPPVMDTALDFLDNAVTIFFLIELIIRYIATGNIRTFFKKGWNIFDTIIVLGSLYPAAGSTIFIARLLRIFRVLRLVSMVPELRILVNALIKSIPQMGYIALLMFVIFYIYGAIGSMIFHDINPTLWGDVAISMLTLFRVATFEDWTDVMYETMTVFPLSWLYYLSFIFLTAFIFLNMMVGAVLEVMSQEHQQARDEKRAARKKAEKKEAERQQEENKQAQLDKKSAPMTEKQAKLLLEKIEQLQAQVHRVEQELKDK